MRGMPIFIYGMRERERERMVCPKFIQSRGKKETYCMIGLVTPGKGEEDNRNDVVFCL